jgi:hypothetical protein
MKHKWPPGVTRAMHQFSEAAPVAPSLTSVYEHPPIPPSRRPRTAHVESEEHLVPVKEIYVSPDSPPTSEVRNPRRLAMAAAAVVAVVGVAAIATNSPNSDDDVEPAPAAEPTVAPTTVAATTVAPRTGTGFFAGDDSVPLTFTVPALWAVVDRDLVARPGAPGNVVHHLKQPNCPTNSSTGSSSTPCRAREEASVAFWDVGNIYAEGCQSVLFDPPVGPTVDDLVSAFANLPGLAPTAAVDVTVDGYVGKQIELTVPDYKEDECKDAFALWQEDGNQNVTPRYAPNQHNQLWILDVNGTRLVIVAASYPDTSPQDRADLDEILASIQIG